MSKTHRMSLRDCINRFFLNEGCKGIRTCLSNQVLRDKNPGQVKFHVKIDQLFARRVQTGLIKNESSKVTVRQKEISLKQVRIKRK